jgi:hypothetical protein
MNSPILRMATSTNAIRGGFIAAGLTIAGIVFFQSFSVVTAWIVALVI